MPNFADDFIAPKCHEEIEILYQDDDILVINKPSGLLSLSGKNPKNLDSVHYRLRQLFPSCLMIHRLDLGTSGIMLLALNKDANKHLCNQFSQRLVSKRYVALLNGIVEQDSGTIDAAIMKDEFPRHKAVNMDMDTDRNKDDLSLAKPAQSRYRVLNRDYDSKISLIEYEPVTGRTHQLRIHSQVFGHEILGCDLYACASVYERAPRLMLHACQLRFDHPTTGQPMLFDCPAPF